MVFKYSLKALIEEELIEVSSMLDHFDTDIANVFKDLSESEKIDRDNDKLRHDVKKFLLSAFRNHTMRDFEGANNDVHAAMQKLAEQEELDFQDDKPRLDAMLKLSRTQGKIFKCREMIRNYIGKLNRKPEEQNNAE